MGAWPSPVLDKRSKGITMGAAGGSGGQRGFSPHREAGLVLLERESKPLVTPTEAALLCQDAQEKRNLDISIYFEKEVLPLIVKEAKGGMSYVYIPNLLPPFSKRLSNFAKLQGWNSSIANGCIVIRWKVVPKKAYFSTIISWMKKSFFDVDTPIRAIVIFVSYVFGGVIGLIGCLVGLTVQAVLTSFSAKV